MKVAFVSDTHNRLNRVTIPKCDVLVHAGDATMMGGLDEISKFNDDVQRLKDNGTIEKVVMIAGNHDWGFQTRPHDSRQRIPAVDYYLQDSECTIEGIKFYGSPWQPEFCNWAFNLPRGKALEEKWALIPADTDVLITHGPPHGFLDHIMLGTSVGCVDLLNAVMLVRPKYHVFGHIHWAYGMRAAGGIIFANASACDEIYAPVNSPHLVEM